MKKYISLCIFVFLFFTLNSTLDGKTDSVNLKFNVSGKFTKNLSLGDLKANLEVHELEFFDPVYKKIKHYKAFNIQDLLQFGFGNLWRSEAYTDIVFTALDGYEAISKISKLKETGGYITFLDMDVEGWEPIGRKKANPGPFYIVWTGKNQTTKNKYPWPWQLVSINIIQFDEQSPEKSPKD